MVEKQKLYLSELGDNFRFSYGDNYDVSASYIYKRILELEDNELEPVGLIINVDEVDASYGNAMKSIVETVNIDDNGKLELTDPVLESLTIHFQTVPVIIDVTKEDIAEGHKCLGCKTSYFAQKACPVCGNEGNSDEVPPIFIENILKRDAYRPQEFCEYMHKCDIEEISKTYPSYDCQSDFVLWITIDLYEPFINENVYGSINILKKDGSSIPVDTVIRKPYRNKSYYQISKKVKMGRSWKRNFGIPLVFKSLEEIKEIDRFIIKWELHTKVEDELYVDTMIVNHPFSIREYCNDGRKKFISVKLRDYFLETLLLQDSFRLMNDYKKEFARTCVFEDKYKVETLQSKNADQIYNEIHNGINNVIYEDEITSSEEVISIKPNLAAIKKTLKTNNLSDNFVWRITSGMRYIKGNLNYHTGAYR